MAIEEIQVEDNISNTQTILASQQDGDQENAQPTTVSQGTRDLSSPKENQSTTKKEFMEEISGCPMISDKTWTIVCAVAALVLILAPLSVMLTTKNNIRTALKKGGDSITVELISVSVIVGLIYPGTIVCIALRIYVTPGWDKKHAWLKSRVAGWLIDIGLFVLSSYLGLCLKDGISLVISYTCCLHFIPMANMIGAFENMGMFDGILSISLGATLTVMRGNIIVRLVVIFIIAFVYFTFRHTSEHCRDRRNKKREQAGNNADPEAAKVEESIDGTRNI